MLRPSSSYILFITGMRCLKQADVLAIKAGIEAVGLVIQLYIVQAYSFVWIAALEAISANMTDNLNSFNGSVMWPARSVIQSR